MELVYISHPYTGDEAGNTERAEELAASLAREYPGILLVNPLNAMRHLRRAGTRYSDVMGQCLALLGRCDGLVMAHGWEGSVGCQLERKRAIRLGMPVWDSPEEFRAGHGEEN